MATSGSSTCPEWRQPSARRKAIRRLAAAPRGLRINLGTGRTSAAPPRLLRAVGHRVVSGGRAHLADPLFSPTAEGEKIDLILSNWRSRDERRGDLFGSSRPTGGGAPARRVVERYVPTRVGPASRRCTRPPTFRMRAAIRAAARRRVDGEDGSTTTASDDRRADPGARGDPPTRRRSTSRGRAAGAPGNTRTTSRAPPCIRDQDDRRAGGGRPTTAATGRSA